MTQQQNPRRVGTLIWGALVAGLLAFLGVSLYLYLYGRMPANGALVGVMLPVVAGLTIVDVALSWLWAVRMKPKLPPGASPHAPEALALTRLIVACALCEGAALFAIVGFLVTQDPVLLAPFALALVALLAHFPGDRHWARLAGAPAGPPARGAAPNRMIRGG
jgi:hypothetical protein